MDVLQAKGQAVRVVLRNLILTLFIMVNSIAVNAQSDMFDTLLKSMLDFSVDTIKARELNRLMQEDSIVILDAREPEEYSISHIKGAINIGYDNFSLDSVKGISKDSKIVIYCSVGYRSEKTGEKLNADGFKDVSNLYGGIFEWINQELPVYDISENETEDAHAYSKEWGKWLIRGLKKYGER